MCLRVGLEWRVLAMLIPFEELCKVRVTVTTRTDMFVLRRDSMVNGWL